MAILPVQQRQRPLQQQARPQQSGLDKNLQLLMQGLQIANQGFGIAVNLERLQSEGLKQEQLGKQIENMPTAKAAQEQRQVEQDQQKAKTRLTNAQASNLEQQFNPQFIQEKKQRELQAKNNADIKGFFDSVEKDVVFKEGRAKVMESSGLIELSKLADQGSEQAKNLMQLIITKAAQGGGVVTDNDLKQTGASRKYDLVVKRFISENFAGEPLQVDVSDLLDLARSQATAGQQQIKQSIQDNALRSAQLTGGRFTPDQLSQTYKTSLLNPIEFPEFTRETPAGSSSEETRKRLDRFRRVKPKVSQ